MLQSQNEQSVKKNSGKVVVGYDLGRMASQISICFLSEKEPETVSSVAGTEQYNIPSILCKRKGVNQWFYGKEAARYALEEEGILIEDLLGLADRGEPVVVDGEEFDSIALLTLFIKRSFSLVNRYVSFTQIEAIMFTVDELSPRMVDVLSKVAVGMQLKIKHIYFQSHMESFYYYIIHQNTELWKYKVLIYDYSDDLQSLCLDCNKKTSPQVIFIEKQEYADMKRPIWVSETKEQHKSELDNRFLQIVEKNCRNNIISTVFLLGDGFKENWTTQTVRFLCRNRRVFQGNNLYSKGACLGALERLEPSEEAKKYVFLGENKLKSNIGMRVQRRGEESYFAVMDAGKNWYEAVADFDIILESGNTVDFIITPLTGGAVTERSFLLEGITVRPERATRLNVHVEMSAADKITATIEDRGFGEIFPSSGKGWTQTINV